LTQKYRQIIGAISEAKCRNLKTREELLKQTSEAVQEKCRARSLARIRFFTFFYGISSCIFKKTLTESDLLLSDETASQR